MPQITAKQVCIFLTGFIVGMVFTMILTLSMLEQRINSLESPFASVGYELESLKAEIHSLRAPVQSYYEQAGTARMVLEDCIEIGRNEVNSYNRAFGEKIGER